MNGNECAYEGCELERRSSKFCILHDPNPEKDPGEFEKTLEEKIRQEEGDPAVETVNLAGLVFPVEVNWPCRVLQKSVSFQQAKFVKAADFKGAEFSGQPDFTAAEFSGEADFSGASFKRLAIFEWAKFSAKADFGFVQFSHAASFSRARFLAIADFGGGRFSAGAAFRGTEFFGEARFPDADFSGKADFGPDPCYSEAPDGRSLELHWQATCFSKGADFWRATFRKELRFRNTIFPVRGEAGTVDFREVTLDEPEKVFFEHVDVSRVSFLRTDMSRVNLTDVTWPAKQKRFLSFSPDKVDKVFGKTYQLYDHQVLRPENEKIPDAASYHLGRDVIIKPINPPQEKKGADSASCRLVENLYRQLRCNLEDRKQYIEAGDFHIGEMEMRCLNPETPRHYRCFLEAYKLFAHYGESYFRPLSYWLAFSLLFAFLYVFSGFKVMDEVVQYQSFTWEPQLAFLWHYIQAFFAALAVPPLIQPDFHLMSSWVAPLRFLNSLLNIVLIALALIAFRHRFKR